MKGEIMRLKGEMKRKDEEDLEPLVEITEALVIEGSFRKELVLKRTHLEVDDSYRLSSSFTSK
jgi:hypothetical protein